VAETENFAIREVVKGLYAIDGIFRDEVDYFAPSPLYQKGYKGQADSSAADETTAGSAGGDESRHHSEDR